MFYVTPIWTIAIRSYLDRIVENPK